MKMLSTTASDAYRKVDLDARIEASSGADLTRICLEEAVGALGQALLALERSPRKTPREALARAHGIAMWLTRSLDPDNPLRDQLFQFYGALAEQIRRNMAKPNAADLMQARTDLTDLLEAASAAAC